MFLYCSKLVVANFFLIKRGDVEGCIMIVSYHEQLMSASCIII